jgi:hypothetical protein
MNDIETHSPAQNSSVESQVEALQRQIFLQLLALIVIGATVVFYLYYQSHVASADYNGMRPRAIEIINTYNQHAMQIDNIDKELKDYGTKHPTFQPILMKYQLILPPPGATAPKQ